MNFLNLLFGLFIFIVAYKHYKSIFNPIGVFSAEWLILVFMYNLKLSYLLPDLSLATYAAIYISIWSFLLGGLLLTKMNSKFSNPDASPDDSPKSKLILLYLILFAICALEIEVGTPAFLSEGKLETYLSPTGRGLVFLHMATVLFPISYAFIFMSSKFKTIYKFVLFFPPFIVLVLWMERGMLLGYLTMLIIIYYRRKSIKQILFNFVVLTVCILAIIDLIGSLRSTSSFRGNSYITKVSEMKVDIPSYLAWAYIYPTTSLANFDRAMKNAHVRFSYGSDIVKPFLLILQMNYILDLEGENTDYEVVAGFNTPTYLYWCYKNFSFLGFFFIPFLMGLISQYLFNQYVGGRPRGIVLYSIWLSYVFVSFHDFLLWNSMIIFSALLVIIFSKNLSKKLN